MKKIKKEFKEVDVLKEVHCNKCGSSMKVTASGSDEFYGLVGCKVHGGFNSSNLEDGISYEFDLCEKCLSKLFETFKHPVSKTRYL